GGGGGGPIRDAGGPFGKREAKHEEEYFHRKRFVWLVCLEEASHLSNTVENSVARACLLVDQVAFDRFADLSPGRRTIVSVQLSGSTSPLPTRVYSFYAISLSEKEQLKALRKHLEEEMQYRKDEIERHKFMSNAISLNFAKLVNPHARFVSDLPEQEICRFHYLTTLSFCHMYFLRVWEETNGRCCTEVFEIQGSTNHTATASLIGPNMASPKLDFTMNKVFGNRCRRTIAHVSWCRRILNANKKTSVHLCDMDLSRIMCAHQSCTCQIIVYQKEYSLPYRTRRTQVERHLVLTPCSSDEWCMRPVSRMGTLVLPVRISNLMTMDHQFGKPVRSQVFFHQVYARVSSRNQVLAGTEYDTTYGAQGSFAVVPCDTQIHRRIPDKSSTLLLRLLGTYDVFYVVNVDALHNIAESGKKSKIHPVAVRTRPSCRVAYTDYGYVITLYLKKVPDQHIVSAAAGQIAVGLFTELDGLPVGVSTPIADIPSDIGLRIYDVSKIGKLPDSANSSTAT
ncbi:hypothetical protein CLF_105201, partial [Clonorchis sinensis]